MSHTVSSRFCSRCYAIVAVLFMFAAAGVQFDTGAHAAWGKRSIDDFVEDAQKGDARDWAELGFIYLSGNDCAPQNFSEAHKWINKAVSKRHPLGFMALGLANYSGQGVPKDRDKAEMYFRQALPGLKQLAEEKDPRALSALAGLADSGIAMPEDAAMAFAWAKKGAEKGSPDAMMRLADMYQRGRGVEKSDSKAFKWIKKAAGKGYSGALCRMGDIAYFGEFDQKKDYKKALDYYEDAAELGHAGAHVDVAHQYFNGKGVEVDKPKALEFYRRAADLGSARGMRRLGVMYKDGEGFKQDYAEAARWFEKAVANNDASAMVELGLLYERGRGVEKDPARALELYLMAAEEGRANGMANAAWMYEHGVGTRRDYAKALEWYRKAVGKKHNRSRVNLALMMHGGKGVAKDWPGALRLLEAAADAGSVRGKREYGVALTEWDGEGVSPNPAKGLEYLKAAAKADDVEGMYHLGRHYPNLKEGKKWLTKAASKGSTDAMIFLAGVYESDKDYKAACDSLKQAVDAGAMGALPKLAQCYAKGQGRTKDFAKAEKMLRDGVVSGHIGYGPLVKLLREQKRNTTGMSLLEAENEHLNPSASAKGKPKNSVFKIPICAYKLGQNTKRVLDADVETYLNDSKKAWEAGMRDIALAQLEKARLRNPLALYTLHPLVDLYLSSMPLVPYGRLLQDLEKDLGDTFGFWFSYTNAAAIAGHPDLIRHGVRKMEETARSLKSERDSHMARVAMAPYPAYALMLEGEAGKGYSTLFSAVDGLDESDKHAIAEYAGFFIPLMMQDKKKFYFVLGLDSKEHVLTLQGRGPSPFVDLRTGEVVQPPISPLSPKPKPGLVQQEQEGGAPAQAVQAQAPPASGGTKKKQKSVVLD